MVQGVEIPIDRNASAVEMAQTIFGDGVTVVGASYTGDRGSSGIYTNGDSIAPGVMPSDTGVMFSTGDLRGFTNSTPWWSNNSNQSSSKTKNSSGPNNSPISMRPPARTLTTRPSSMSISSSPAT